MWNFHTNIFLFFILQETNLHIELRHDDIMKLPDEAELKQRVMDVLAEWEQLLLNDFSGGRWAWTFPGSSDYSLVYVSKDKFNGERYVSVQTIASSNTS